MKELHTIYAQALAASFAPHLLPARPFFSPVASIEVVASGTSLPYWPAASPIALMFLPQLPSLSAAARPWHLGPGVTLCTHLHGCPRGTASAHGGWGLTRWQRPLGQGHPAALSGSNGDGLRQQSAPTVWPCWENWSCSKQFQKN